MELETEFQKDPPETAKHILAAFAVCEELILCLQRDEKNLPSWLDGRTG